MNSTPPTIPGLKSLYWNDAAIRRSANAFGFGLIIAAGMKWASQPVDTGLPPIDNSANLEFAKWVILGGLVLSALGGLILLWRYLWVRKVFTQGITLKGMVENIEVHSWSQESSSSSSSKSVTRYSYYATLRYDMQGKERKVRLKLPNSGFTFGLAKGKETDLVVLDSAPEKPFIRAVYLGSRP